MRSRILCLSVVLLLVIVLTLPAAASSPPDSSNRGSRAVSLRILQQQLRQSEGQPLPDQLRDLGGLTRIDGFIIDSKGRDLVLVGIADGSGAPLRTDDFVVALRNAWKKDRDKESTDEASLGFLGCSIDHDPGTFQVLMEAGQRLGRQEPMPGDTERWNKLCERPMQISVSGAPAASHFAQVLVEADLTLKKLVMGVDRPDPSFRSLVDFIKDQAELVAKTGGRFVLLPLLHVWLVPGANVYAEGGNATWLDACPVVMSSEECLVMDGKFACTGRKHPPVEKFADHFSDRYADIVKLRPEFARLESLYRLVAIARAFKYKGIERSISYLLDSFPVPSPETPTSTSGLPQLARIAKPKLQFGIKIQKWVIPACGGINMEIDVEQAEVITRAALEELEAKVLKARPSAESLCWEAE